MTQLTEKDAEILDRILKIVLTEGYANSQNLPPLSDHFFASLNVLFDYKYYLEILRDFKIVEFKECIGDNVVIDKIQTKTINFYKQ